MPLKRKILAAAGAVTLIAGLAGLTAGTASASSTGCAFTNGCATLQGVDAASHAVAMDAKRQSPASGTLIIGYPDRPNDGATNFDAVLHFTSGTKVTTYADTGFQLSPTFTSVPCLLTTDPRVTPTVTGSTLTANDNLLTVKSTTGLVTVTPSSGTSLTLGGGAGNLTVDEQYADDGNSCVAAYSGPATATSFAPGAPDTAPLTFPTSPGGSTWTFLDSDTGGTFTFTGLPAGVSVSGGSLTADTSTAVPGVYTNVGVSYTATDGAVWTATFTLTISGITTVNPGPDVPFYTFVYAKNGVWSSQCVTDVSGSGALQLEPCTLGKNRYQDFYALNGSGNPSDALTGGGQFRIQDVLAAIVNGASSCLTDPSSLSPGIPQTDATDQAGAPVPGRQLRVDGSCSATGNLWTWAS